MTKVTVSDLRTIPDDVLKEITMDSIKEIKNKLPNAVLCYSIEDEELTPKSIIRFSKVDNDKFEVNIVGENEINKLIYYFEYSMNYKYIKIGVYETEDLQIANFLSNKKDSYSFSLFNNNSLKIFENYSIVNETFITAEISVWEIIFKTYYNNYEKH